MVNAAPGTAELCEMFLELTDRKNGNSERKRAMILSWVDELEREQGYGDPGQKPRTAQIRQWWKAQGEPEIGG